jgi:hypothetical protein
MLAIPAGSILPAQKGKKVGESGTSANVRDLSKADGSLHNADQ